MKKGKNHMQLCFITCLVFFSVECPNLLAQRVVKVGLVVNRDDQWVGKMGSSCVEMAVSEFYESRGHYSTRLALHVRDSDSDTVGAASAALDLIKNVQVQAIIGSMTPTQANFVVDLCEKARIPIISYSATDRSLSQRSSYYFQATQGAKSQMKAVGAIVKHFGWTKVVPIFSDATYNDALMSSLTDALRKNEAHAPYVSVISSSPSTDVQLVDELHKLTRMQTRVFVVHSDVSTGMRIFAKANEIGMMGEGYAWIVTNEMTSFFNSLESSVVDSMQGVLGIKVYVPETKELKRFRARWRKLQRQQENQSVFCDFELNAFGFSAYDAAAALAYAVEKTGNEIEHIDLGESLHHHHLEILGVSVSRNGTKLLRALSSLKQSKGFSGRYSLSSNSTRFASSTYQIVNIHGSGEKTVGFWTRNGLAARLDITEASSNKLGLIVWPGESIFVPKGGEITTTDTSGRFQIGVPVKHGLTEFIKVEYDHVTNTKTVTGYCIDIFDAVVKQLPYKFDYELIPYEPHLNLYDDLVAQVYHGRFDAAVGDITITENRSLYVDFTVPYTESGISIIMPAKPRNDTSTWIFLKPLTWDLWAFIASFFVFNAFVIWILERQENGDFRGPLSYQIGTSLWFSFSTVVYAHREKLLNNLARFVVVIWIFVVLILTQCYAASLTSLLTIQQLRPPKTESVLSELLKTRENVAYESYLVYKPLKELGFADSQLRRYHRLEEAHELVLKGEVAAIIDEIPYNKLFLSKFCSNYGYFDLVDKRLRAEGFAFVFQRGSPLTRDFSKALMKTIRESEIIRPIENKWLGRKTDCKDPNEEVDYSNRLGVKSFSGLFMISGFSSAAALAIHAITIFCCDTGNSNPAEASTRENFLLRFAAFYRKLSTAKLFVRGEARVDAVESTSTNQQIIAPESSQSNYADASSTDFLYAVDDNEEPSSFDDLDSTH